MKKLGSNALIVFLIVLMISGSLLTAYSFAPESSSVCTLKLWDSKSYDLWEADYLPKAGDTAADYPDKDSGDDVYSLIFDSYEDFEKWLAPLDRKYQNYYKSMALVVKGTDLPDNLNIYEVSVNSSGDREIDPESLENAVLRSSETEAYIVVPRALIRCPVCRKLVEFIISCLLYDILYDPVKEKLLEEWEEVKTCIYNHIISTTYIADTTQCPYINYCGSTWQAMVHNYGAWIECGCSCGALWYSYAP